MDVDPPAPIRKLNFDKLVADTPTKKRPSQPTNIEVFLRIRPTDPRQPCTAQYSISNDHQSIRLTAPNKTDKRSYSFNHIFDPTTTNPQVYDRIGRKTIDRFIAGYTNLIFTYGITGSGKTHTITGNGSTMDGLLPSILRGVFNHEHIRNKNKYQIFATYLENYTKDLYNLLSDDHSAANNKENMNMRNHHAYNTNKRSNNTNKVTLRVLPDDVDIVATPPIHIRNAQEAIQLIERGNARRSKAHTKLNRNSSRSHVLFILDLFEGDQLKSRLCLVDLAGSESAKRAGFTVNDIGFNEACEINTSLSCLGRCIESIQNKHNAMKAPWREVTLTKLLWAYLRGKGFVNMIVTAHITNDDYNETMRALEFAATTQNIEMNPVVNSVRPSTRHRQRICKTPRKTEGKSSSVSATPSRQTSREGSVEINFMNSCSVDQLRKIAIESYKSALRSRDMIRKLRDDKVAMFDKLVKSGILNKMKGIEEESAMDVDEEEDGDLVDKCNKEWAAKYNAIQAKYQETFSECETLRRKMAEHVMNVEENTLKYNYEMSEMKKKHANEAMQQMIQTQDMERKYKEEMEYASRALQLTISDLEHELKGKGATITELEETVDALQVEKISLESDHNALRETVQKLQKEQLKRRQTESQMEGLEEYKEKERKWNEGMEELRKTKKELLIEKHNLEKTTARYKSIMDESEQRIERYTHLNRESKCKIQKQHINITELEGKNAKLNEMMNALKSEYKAKCDEFEGHKGELCKELDQRKRINEDAQKEIVSLNQRLIQKQNELKETHRYKAEFVQLTEEFIQREEELKNAKNMLTALTKQMTNQNLVYEQKMSALNQDIVDQKQILQDDIQSKSQTIQELKEAIKSVRLECEHKAQTIRNEGDARCTAQDKIIAQKTQRMEEIQGKLKAITDEKERLTQHMKENDNWSEKYQKLFATFTQHTDQNKILKKKYADQSEQLAQFKAQIHALKQCKEELIANVNTVRDEMEKGLKATYDKLVTQQTEIMRNKCIEMQNLQSEYKQSQQQQHDVIQHKDKQIEEWQSKYIENDAVYHQLKAEYDILDTKYSEIMNTHDTMGTEWIETLDSMQSVLEEKQNEIEMIQNELEDTRATLGHKESELETLQDEMTKQKEFHRLALKEADEEYLKEQQESKELYELNVEWEGKNKRMCEEMEGMNKDTRRLQEEIRTLRANETRLIQNHANELNELQQRLSEQIANQCEERYQMQLTEQTDSLQKQLKSLQEQLKELQLQSQPQSRRESGLSISDIADRRRGNNRKRSREQMESQATEQESHPNKRRKITIDGGATLGIAMQHNSDNNQTSSMEQDDDDEDEDEDDTNIFDELQSHRNQSCSVNKSDSSSLQPQNLLSEYNETDASSQPSPSVEASITINAEEESESCHRRLELTSESELEVGNEEEDDDDDDVEIRQSDDSLIELKEETTNILHETPEKPKSKSKPKATVVVTPALSHLSEGDTPLIKPRSSKPSTSKVRKAIQRHNKPKATYNKSTPNHNKLKPKQQRYLAMRTPATKDVKSRRRHTTQPFDINAPTPTTKPALTKLRVVDLREKLKKHNLKTQGKKAVLVQTLFDHKNATKEEDEADDTSSEKSESPMPETEWIGKCIQETEDKRYYNGIRINGAVYSVGSEVFVTNESGNDWLAQVVELYEEESGCFMNNVWFWRHNEIAKAIKIKPYNAWKPGENEVFLSNGHDLDKNHISLINLEKQFKVFECKKEMQRYTEKRKKSAETCEAYYCEYIFNLKGHKLIPKSKKHRMEDIEEEDDNSENDIVSENNIIAKSKAQQRPKRKRKTTSSKCESPKNKKPRRPRRRKQKSTK